tara:strand:+ start:185 stop:682 length:498 start_codon:yes stop_codon:yes gene_type:complete
MNNKKNNYKLFQSKVQNVNKEWIDYNGHMNVAYYTLAFDKALDDFLEKILEIGPTFVEKEKQGPYSLQANYHYLDELRLLDKFFSKIYLVDSDKKKIHLVLEMINFNTKKQVAVCETLLINVDLNIRKSVEYGSHTIKKIEKYKYISKMLSLPLQIGKNLHIKKK